MDEGGPPAEESQDPRDLDVQALRQEVELLRKDLEQEIELLRKDLEQQATRLDGRIDMLGERTSNTQSTVNTVILAIVVSIAGTVAATLILRAMGLG